MATLTRLQMVDKVMRRLGVLGAGQSAGANDAAEVGQVLDNLHDEYRALGLAPFATSAFPTWAQEPFAKIIGEDAAPYFGLNRQGWKDQGQRDLTKQLRTHNKGNPIRAKYF